MRSERPFPGNEPDGRTRDADDDSTRPEPITALFRPPEKSPRRFEGGGVRPDHGSRRGNRRADEPRIRIPVVTPFSKNPRSQARSVHPRVFWVPNPQLRELDTPDGRNILVTLGSQAPSIRAAAGPSYFEPPEYIRIPGIIHRRSSSSPALIRRVTSAIIRRRPRHTDRATPQKVAAVLQSSPTPKPASRVLNGVPGHRRIPKVGLASGWITISNPGRMSGIPFDSRSAGTGIRW